MFVIVLLFSYPSQFIDAHFRKFISNYAITTSNFLPLVDDETVFFRMRTEILDIPTQKQTQTSQRSAKVILHNIDKENIIIQEEAKEVHTTVPKTNQWHHRLLLHYTHEKRLESYKQDINQISEKIFANTPVMDTKLIVGNRDNSNLQREVIHKRPHQSLLVNKETSSERYFLNITCHKLHFLFF